MASLHFGGYYVFICCSYCVVLYSFIFSDLGLFSFIFETSITLVLVHCYLHTLTLQDKMRSALILAAALLLVTTTGIAADDYLAFFPKQLKLGSTFNLNVQIMPTSHSTLITCTAKIIRGKSLAWTGSEVTLSFPVGVKEQSGSISVPDSLTDTSLYMSLTFSNLNVSSKSKLLNVMAPASGLFIQTDKAKYKPGDTVMFRAVNVGPNLEPITTGTLTVTLKDPKDNVVLSVKSNELTGTKKAILPGEFEISEDPLFGTWSLSAVTAKGTKMAYFEVEEYVLPRFEVKIKQLRQDGQTLKGLLQAKYTHGKPVQGRMALKVNGVVRMEDSQFDGDEEFELTFEELGLTSQGTVTPSVFVQVFEAFTDIQMNATETISVIVTNLNFGVAFVQPLPLQSLSKTSYSFMVKLTDAYGGPFTGPVNNYNVYWQPYTSLGRSENQSRSMAQVTEEIVVDISNNDGGNVIFYRIEVWITNGRDTTQKISAEVKQYRSESGDSLTIEKVNSANQNEACFKVPEYDGQLPVYYQILTNTAGPILPYTQSQHCFTISEDHAPSSMVIAYKVVTNQKPKDLLTASMLMDFPWQPRNQVSLEVTPEVTKPGGEVSITIQSNGPSLVGLSGVDASTLILAQGKENAIRTTQLRDFMKTFRLFSTGKTSSGGGWGDPMPMPRMLGGGGVIMNDAICADCFFPVQTDLYPYDILLDAGIDFLSEKVVAKKYPTWWNDDAILANVPLEKAPGMEMDMNEVGVMEDNAGNKQSNFVDSAPAPAPMETRSLFPETWLFDLLETSENGVIVLPATVPDTITNWTLDAFALSASHGLGVAPTTEITVFKEFFLVMNLPYSIVRHEGFNLEILVFNYLASPLNVTVKLVGSDDFRINSGQVQNIVIGGLATGAVEIPIQALTIGDMFLRAEVTVNNHPNIPGDAVERYLPVKAEGIEFRMAKEGKYDVVSNQGLVAFNISSLFKNPPLNATNLVPGSLRMYMRVTGDLMGPFIASLGSKIQMPFGCGEQNIITLTPSIFVGKYLKSIDRFEQKLKDKVAKICATGYAKELAFEHPDFSYSAFGVQGGCGCTSGIDPSGSTWLTAYVLRIYAELFNEGFAEVDKTKMNNIFGYIKSMYTPKDTNVMFMEQGRVIHQEMQGGTQSGVGFSAFCLISVMQYRTSLKIQREHGMANTAAETAVDELLEDGATWLRGQSAGWVEGSTPKPYLLAITASALSRATTAYSDVNYNEAARLLALYEMGTAETPLECPTVMYWMRCSETQDQINCQSNNDCNDQTVNKLCCQSPCSSNFVCTQGVKNHGTGPSEVETLGYALLSYISLHSLSPSSVAAEIKIKATQHMNFLVDMRKDGGFFESTQDTAIALEALSQYAIEFPESTSSDFSVQAVSGGEVVSEKVVFKSNNYTILAEEKLRVRSDVKPTDMYLNIEGTAGNVFATIVAIYNVQGKASVSNLQLDVQTYMENGQTVLQSCVWSSGGDGPSSMVVVTIDAPSGHVFEQVVSINDETKKAKKVDMKENAATIYYMDDVNDKFNDKRCAKIFATKNVEITNMQPSVVRALDYYSPENNVEVLYTTTMNLKTTGGAMGLVTSIVVILVSTITGLLLVSM